MNTEQKANAVLMISPTRFGFNEEAFLTNTFQNKPQVQSALIQEKAKKEFNLFVEKLRELHVDVVVYDDTENSTAPDSIFPNNWFSTHQNGKLILYPMAVSNRRKERRKDIIEELKSTHGYTVADLSYFESKDPALFLEGTGSLILDRVNKVAYAALSPRTNEPLLKSFSEETGFDTIAFHALGKIGELIYHTNVMMCVADNYIIIGLDTIIEEDRKRVEQALIASEKEIIQLTNEQVYECFAGNMLQIKNTQNESILVMSQKALEALTDDQLERLRQLNDHILPIEIPTIEEIGGGSVRCMMAELFY